MKLSQRLKGAWHGFKGLTISGGGLSGFYGANSLNVAGKRGPLWEASAVAACLRFACDTFPEGPIQVLANELGNEVPVEAHKLTALIARPNAFYSGTTLWAGTILSLMMPGGNAYWYKARNGASQVQELWYLPHFEVKPKWPLDGSAFITHYEYTANGRTQRIEIEDIVHFRRWLDPQNPRIGWSPLTAVLQEVLTDAEAAVACHAIMKTRGLPGMIIRPKDKDASMTVEQADAIKLRYEQMTGTGRGGVLPISIAADVDFPNIDVEKMAFDKVRSISAERICAAFGLDPMAVSLPSQNKTFSNYGEAREAAYESFIIPMQRAVAETLDVQLLPELGNPQAEHVAFDLSKVRVLQEDRNKEAERIARLYSSGVTARRQSQELLGLDEPLPDDVYVQDVTAGVTGPMKSLKDGARKRAVAQRILEENAD